MSVELQQRSEPAPSTRNAQAASTVYNCPSCGTPVAVDPEGPEEAARVIRELQAQMEALRQTAAAAGMFKRSTSSRCLLQQAYALYRKAVCRLRESDAHNENPPTSQRQPACTQQHLGLSQYFLSRRPPFDRDADSCQITVTVLLPHWKADLTCELGKRPTLAYLIA